MSTVPPYVASGLVTKSLTKSARAFSNCNKMRTKLDSHFLLPMKKHVVCYVNIIREIVLQWKFADM